MSNSKTPLYWEEATNALSSADEVMGGIIKVWDAGP